MDVQGVVLEVEGALLVDNTLEDGRKNINPWSIILHLLLSDASLRPCLSLS